jgi:hypothetical protein
MLMIIRKHRKWAFIRGADPVTRSRSRASVVTETAQLRKGAPIPPELQMFKDRRVGHEGHYMLPPRRDMALKRYIGILEEFERDPMRCTKLSPKEIQNG